MHCYATLPKHIKDMLESIAPSHDGGLEYFPCRAFMKNGDVLDAVYIEPEKAYFKHWGVYPEDDQAKHWVRLEDIERIEESPSRLPARFANLLYENGESGMGFTIFTVVFSDTTKQVCISGNAVDFVQYPPGKGQGDVVQVIPHEGHNDKPLVDAPIWYWCLYSETI